MTGSSSNITPYRLPVPSTLVQVSTAMPLASYVTILSPPRLQTPTLLSPIRSMPTPSTPPPLTDVTNLPVAFTLKRIQETTIRSCYGCGGAIRLRTATVPPPPHDLVIRYKEQQHYRDHITKELKYTAAAENIHYHFTLSCVQKKHPSFQPAKLIIPRDYYTLNYCNS